MDLSKIDFIKIVSDLNDHLLKVNEDSVELFFYTTSGYYHILGFGNYTLWSSTEDDRIYDEKTDEYEDMYLCVRRKFNEKVDELRAIKFFPKQEERKDKLKRILSH